MDRREKLLAGLAIEHKLGLEIGALCRPFIKKTEHPVLYADHASTQALREKYRHDPDVVLDDIVEVDAVLGERSLAEALGRKVDYVVASHVIEHVPDLITWLGELASILNDNGEIRLIVPDKRFTFDYIRTTTQLSDVLYAHLVKARMPQAHIVMDYVLNVVKVNGAQAWRGAIDPDTLERHHTLGDAQRIAQQILDCGAYHDVHCWVFTPRSLALLFAELAGHGLTCFECVNFYDTALDTIEFFVGLRRTNDPGKARQSWLSMAARAREHP
jgi:predicted SAM-dependent methyltransferase